MYALLKRQRGDVVIIRLPLVPHWASFYTDANMLEKADYFDGNVTCARSDIRLNISTTL
ncbi:hypothetical protein BV898_19971, partial [Hypsibius exemplaris]